MHNSQSTVTREGTQQTRPPIEDSFDHYDFASNQAKNLINTWSGTVLSKLALNRKLREYEFDIKALRDRGTIAPDSTYIPVRAIDLAVKRVTSKPLSFVNNTKHLVVFESEGGEQQDSINNKLAETFTKGFRYRGWLFDHIRWIDAAAFNGIGFMEVELDTTKPLDYALVFVENANVMFPKDTKETIENAEYILRRYEVSINTLRTMRKKFKFPAHIIDRLIELRVNSNESDDDIDTDDTTVTQGNSNIELYKLLFKDPETGYVRVAWLHPDLDTWIKAPEDLYLGRDEKVMAPPVLDEMPTIDIQNPLAPSPEPIETFEPMPETRYPVFQLTYEVTENTNIFSSKGLAKKLEPIQEAQSTMVSAYVNGASRSVEFIGSPKEATDVTGSEPKQTGGVIETGKMMDRPMNFTSLPSPDPNMIGGIRFLQQLLAEDTGDIAFTVSNRQDARKTAKEMELAEGKEQELKSDIEALTLLAYEDLFEFTYDHVLNRAQNDKIVLLKAPPASPTGDGVDNQPAALNDPIIQQVKFNVLFAARIELIERAQKQQQLRGDLQIFGGTPVGEQMMIDIIKGTYPDEADRYLQAMQVGAAQKQIISGLLQLLQQALSEEELKALPQQQQQQVQQLMEQAAQAAKQL